MKKKFLAAIVFITGIAISISFISALNTRI